MLERLFKRTTKGAIQVWDIEVDHANARYRTITGQLDGKQVASEWTVCKPKNVGRSNAVAAQDQAYLEAKAAWEKKQRDGYSTTVELAQGSDRFQCMLADSYVDHTNPKKSRKPRVLHAFAEGRRLFSQPKLDGVRLIASQGSMLSRKGRPIVAVPHIAKALEPIFEKYPDLVLDGELYEHGMRDDFDSLVSLVRKTKPSEDDLAAASVMEYWIYDCAGEWEQERYGVRYAFLQELERNASPNLRVVSTVEVASEEEVDAAYARYLSQGYEGQMLRFDVPYEQKRSDKLLKRKEFEDKEFVVVSVEEGVGNRSGQAGFVVVREPDTGIEFKAGIKAPEEKRIWLLKHRGVLVGTVVTVRYNGRTPSNVPRFPRAVAWFPKGRDV